MAKRISAVILCLVVLFSAFTVPVKAFALTAGSGAALAVLITGLLASGVTIAASSVDLEPAAQAIYNTMDTQMQQLITGVKLAELGGKVFANWTATQWNTFTNWVTTHFYASGETGIVVANPSVSFPSSSSLDASQLSKWQSTFYVGNFPLRYVYNGYLTDVSMSFTDSSMHCTASMYIDDLLSLSFEIGSTSNNRGVNTILCNPTVYWSSSWSTICISFGFPLDYNYNHTSDLDRVRYVMSRDVICQKFVYCNRSFTIGYNNGFVTATSGGITSPVYQGTLSTWFSEILGNGTLVGDFGAWPDVINPADKQLGKPVSIDVNDDEYVGTGIDGLPRTLNPGQSIDVPLGDVIPGAISIDDTGTVSVPIPDVYPDVTPKDVINDVTITDVTDTDIPDVEDLPDNPDDPENTKEKANKMKFPAVAVQKFPFCIPWDFVNAVKMMSAPAAVPEFSIPVNIPSLNYHQTIDISFDSVSTLATVCRWFILAGFILALILATKSIIK